MSGFYLALHTSLKSSHSKQCCFSSYDFLFGEKQHEFMKTRVIRKIELYVCINHLAFVYINIHNQNNNSNKIDNSIIVIRLSMDHCTALGNLYTSTVMNYSNIFML